MTSTSHFVGECRYDGFKDGARAWFFHPYSVIRNIKSLNTVLVTDGLNNAVREVDLITKTTSTFITQSVGLISPTGITFDKLGRYLLISVDASINRYDLKSGILTSIGNSSGLLDGKLKSAKFSTPGGLIFLSKFLY